MAASTELGVGTQQNRVLLFAVSGGFRFTVLDWWEGEAKGLLSEPCACSGEANYIVVFFNLLSLSIANWTEIRDSDHL